MELHETVLAVVQFREPASDEKRSENDCFSSCPLQVGLRLRRIQGRHALPRALPGSSWTAIPLWVQVAQGKAMRFSASRREETPVPSQAHCQCQMVLGLTLACWHCQASLMRVKVKT